MPTVGSADGPGHYPLRMTKRQCDKPRGVAHLRADQDLVLALRLGFAQRLAYIAGIGNRLATDFEDDVAALKTLFGGRAIWVDRGDYNALVTSAGHVPRRRDR